MSGNFSMPLQHYLYMDCNTVHEVMSARIDGEDQRLGAPRWPVSALEAHLESCVACREWQRRAHVVTRRVRLGGCFLDHDLTSRVLAAIASQAAVPRQAEAVEPSAAAPAAVGLSAGQSDANERGVADWRDGAQPGKTGGPHDEAAA